MAETPSLPEQFRDLERFADRWGELETPGQRYLLRQSQSIEELRAFHSAAAHRLDEIFNYLDSFPPGDLPPSEARLFRTVLGLAEVMQAVEVYGEPRIRFAPFPHHLETVWVDLAPGSRRKSSESA
jgi:hypothetical protein